SLDVVYTSPLSLLAWKLREPGAQIGSKYRQSKTFGYFFQWEKNDAEVQKKMILLVRDYLSKGIKSVRLDGNDIRTFCKILDGVKVKQLDLEIYGELPDGCILKFAKYRQIDQLYIDVKEFTDSSPVKFLQDISSQFRTIHIQSRTIDTFFGSDEEWEPTILDIFTRKL
ncbi:hypothetical protein PMAYCL1PPCAC_31618, partial [Pristionchus mayeri]